jgi:hypothetical protein
MPAATTLTNRRPKPAVQIDPVPRNADVAWALDEFVESNRMSRIQLYRLYYYGEHRLAFATDKFRSTFGTLLKAFADNLCESVVDTFTERLEIQAFSTNHASTAEEHITVAQPEQPEQVSTPPDTETEPSPPQPAPGADVTETPAPAPGTKILVTVDDPIADEAWDMWEANYGDVIADEVHREALTTGDGFVIVWPDIDMTTTLWPQYSHEIAVRYAPNRRGRLEVAAKFWITPEKRARLTLYYDDHVERYISRNKVHQLSRASLKPQSFVPYQDDQGRSRVPNPYGRVPVFHFAHKAFGKYGLSVLNNVIPVQDALNKSVCDMLVAMEFAAFRQRWVTGLDVEVDEITGKPKEAPFDMGVDRIVSAGDPETKFGEFGQTDLTQFLSVQRDFRAEIARVVGIPLHYLFTNTSAGDAPSGEALKTSELRFSRNIKKMQSRFGKGWEEAVKFALAVDGSVPSDLDLNAIWMTDSPRSPNELLDELIKKQSIGVPNSQLQKEAGYDADEIKLFALQAAASQPPVAPAPAHDSPEETRSDPATQVRDQNVPPQNQQ